MWNPKELKALNLIDPAIDARDMGGAGRVVELVCIALFTAGVACLAGTAFGREGEGYLRFSYANSIERIRDALDAIEAVLPEVVAAP